MENIVPFATAGFILSYFFCGINQIVDDLQKAVHQRPMYANHLDAVSCVRILFVWPLVAIRETNPHIHGSYLKNDLYNFFALLGQLAAVGSSATAALSFAFAVVQDLWLQLLLSLIFLVVANWVVAPLLSIVIGLVYLPLVMFVLNVIIPTKPE